MAGINPFKPNYPVMPGMFVGRLDEISRLEALLIQTKAGNPSNFMITGERGIGKSSLMLYTKFLAQGSLPINGTSVKYLVIDTDIDQSTTQFGLIKKVELGLKRQLEKTEPARAFLSDAWSFLQRVEAGSLRINPATRIETEELLLEEFSYSLADITNRVCNPEDAQKIFSARYDGTLILIDEADNASKTMALGSFLKLLLERLQRRDCSRVMIGLAGLDGLRSVLIESHPSSIRLFDQLHLERLSTAEVSRVIDLALAEAEEKNGVQTTITDDARGLLVMLSEGYPHFIQQFGFSAFAADQDNEIDEKDVQKGSFGPLGAMEIIGDRYYRNNFYNKIQKESYRQVLRIMADKLDGWVTKQEIRARFRGKETTLTNAIRALRDRGIILSKEGERGVYRLQHKGFALWIKLYTMDPYELQQSLELRNGGKENGGS